MQKRGPSENYEEVKVKKVIRYKVQTQEERFKNLSNNLISTMFVFKIVIYYICKIELFLSLI